MVLDDVSVSVASGYIRSMAGYDWGMDVAAWDRVWFGKGGGIAATIVFVYVPEIRVIIKLQISDEWSCSYLFGMTTSSFVVTAFRDPGEACISYVMYHYPHRSLRYHTSKARSRPSYGSS